MLKLLKSFWRWVFDIFISLDQLANVVFKLPLSIIFRSNLFGAPDETISSVLGKIYSDCGRCRRLCRFLSVFDPRDGDHCVNSIEYDENIKTPSKQ